MIADTTAMDMPQTTNRRFSVTPFIELLVLAGAIAIATVSYFVIVGEQSSQRLLTPPVVALLLVSNLVPGIALLVLLGRRIAMRRAARSPIGGNGRLHVRLVALFSVVAAVPMLLVTIFASLLFQYGVEFWFSDKARGMLENATVLARVSYQQQLDRWNTETLAMAQDISGFLRERPIEDPQFPDFFGRQVYYRNLNESAIFTVSPTRGIQSLALVNPYARNLTEQVSPKTIAALKAQKSVVTDMGDRIQTVTMLPGASDLYLYTARLTDSKTMTAQTDRAEAVLGDYRDLLARSRSLQIRFNAALLLVSLFIVGVAVWIALEVADRLVRPVGELVGAARAVAGGDLTARVPSPKTRDEVGVLADAFNQMTRQLEEQTGALETRRALIEAVMSGVSAGVVATGRDGTIRLINRSATDLLKTGTDSPVGRLLADIAPELAALIGTDQRDAIVEVDAQGEARTLAVRIARAEAGPILTFDDITQQLLDQRRAAWSDVARRIAHEIKNPLTPIQLAAERLQRRYGKQIENDDGTFGRLTETIVRQVGDLRRMVDEFSSFARMPKPLFKHESLVDIARQSLFLHEVAHPGVTFSLVSTPASVDLVCDRRQIGQALTNIIKNAVEAIEAQGEGNAGEVAMTISGDPAKSIVLEVADNGVGLPAARDRIAEPYMTTRARGTGLGLAIVNKIVEEHCGTMAFGDRPGGGTIVTMRFDAAALARMDAGDDDTIDSKNDRLPTELTRTRT
ncbi:sensor histidine kinase [Sphingomonas sp. PB4P5]|uniref:sensor histidine kinase n=1 Tax=Parasphingomonas puruogangriensis TaxID=3096155 RepID=UPI002FC8D596